MDKNVPEKPSDSAAADTPEGEELAVSPIDDGAWSGGIEIPADRSAKAGDPENLSPPAGSGPFLDPTPNRPKERNRRRIPVRRWVKRILIAVPLLLLLLLLAVAGLLFFAGDWVVEKAWPIADRKLSEKGLYLSWDEVSQTRERGIILENVVLFRDPKREQPLLAVGNVAAAFEWGNEAIGGGPGARVTLEDSGLTLESKAGRREVTGLQAILSANGTGLVIEMLEGSSDDLSFDVAGNLFWSSLPKGKDKPAKSPDREKQKRSPKEKSERVDLEKIDLSPVDQVLEWIRVESSGEPVLLTARFDGPDAAALAFDVSLKGADFSWRETRFDRFDLGVAGELTGKGIRMLEVAPLGIVHEGRGLDGELTVDLKQKRITIADLKSNLDWASLLSKIHPPLAGVLASYEFPAPPEIELRGNVFFEEPSKSDLSGRVSLPKGLVMELGQPAPLVVSKFETRFRFEDEWISTEECFLELPGGRIEMALRAQPFAKPLAFEGRLQADRHAVGELARVAGGDPDLEDMLSVDATFSGTPEQIEVSTLKIEHEERFLSLKASVDLKNGQVELSAFESNLDLHGLASRVHPPTGEQLKSIRFHAPPEIKAGGKLSLKEISRSSLTLALTLPKGTEITGFTESPLTVNALRGDFTFGNQTVSTENLHIEIFGGNIDGSLKASPFAKPLQFGGDLQCRDLAPASIAALFPAAAGGTPPADAERFHLACTFEGSSEKIDIANLKLERGERTLVAKAVTDLAGRKVEIASFHSDLDFVGLASEIHPPSAKTLETVHFPAPPTFDLKGTLDYGDIERSAVGGTVDLSGGVVISGATPAPITVAAFRSDMALRDAVFTADNLHAEVFGGTLDGKLKAEPFAKPLTFDTELNGSGLSLASVAAVFPEAPAVGEFVEGIPGEVIAESVETVAEVAAPNIDRVDLTLAARGNASRIEVPALNLTHGDRQLSAQLVVDVANGFIQIPSLDSNVNLVGVASAAHPPTAKKLESLSFSEGPVVRLNGNVFLKQPESSQLQGSVDIPRGLTIRLADDRDFVIRSVSSTIKMEGGDVSTDDLRIEALGGLTQAKIIARPFLPNFPLGVAIQADQISLPEVFAVSGSSVSVPGTVHLTLQGNGLATLTGFNGKGELKVENTQLSLLPVVGKVFDSLSVLDLGLGKKSSGMVNGTYTIQAGVLSTEDLVMKMVALNIIAPGDVDLVRSYLDMDFKMRPSTVATVVSPYSQLARMTIKAQGPFDNIEYDFGGAVTGNALGIIDNLADQTLFRNRNQGNGAPANPDAGPPPGPGTEKPGLFEKLNPFRKKE